MADLNKGSVEAGHQALDFAKENVSNGEVVIGFLVMEFYQFGLLQQRDFHLGGFRMDN